MKKIIRMILTLMITISLVACGTSNSTVNTASGTNSSAGTSSAVSGANSSSTQASTGDDAAVSQSANSTADGNKAADSASNSTSNITQTGKQSTVPGKSTKTGTKSSSSNSANSLNKEASSSEQSKASSETKKILVAYFSQTGNTREIANQIHQNVGGDMFQIETVNPYPTDYNTLVNQAKKEQEENFRPELATEVKNMDSYEVVFIGYPNWWGTMPMPVFTFLEKYDLSGKTIIPFCTHEGSALGRSVEDITKLCSKSTILDGLAIRGSKVKTAQQDVKDWLYKLGMLE